MKSRIAFLVIVTMVPAAFGLTASFLEPSAYNGQADSPIAALPFGYFHLENFEDGLLNTPGVTVSAGFSVLAAGANTDSVDASGQSLGGNGPVTFTFDAGALGTLPTHAGIVWTDGLDNIVFEAFDENGQSLGTRTGTHADGASDGGTDEDRFYGVVHGGGISSIRLSGPAASALEVDHLQYGGFARVAWNNASGGSWHTAANWTPSRVPGAGDVAVIALPGTYTVTVTTAIAPGGISLGGPGVGATLGHTSGNMTPATFLEIAEGSTYHLGQGSSGAVTTFSTAGSLVVDGNLQWSRGALNGTGVTWITPNASASVTATNALTSPRPLVLDGSLTVAAGLTTVTFSGTVQTNGSLSLQSGTLRFTGTGVHDGDVDLAAGSVLKFIGDQELLANVQLSGEGTLHIEAGTTSVVSSLTIGTDVLISQNTTTPAILFANANVQLQRNLTLSLGSLSGPGAFTIQGNMEWNRGSLLAGAGEIVTQGLFSFAGNFTLSMTTRTLRFFGGAQWGTAAAAGPAITLRDGARILNEAGSVWTIDGPANGGQLGATGEGNAIENRGTVIKKGDHNRAFNTAPFLNTGVLEVNGGRLTIACPFIQSGGETKLTGGLISIGFGTLHHTGGRTTGSGQILGAFSHLGGEVDPGFGSGSGLLDLRDLTGFSSDSLLRFDIGGLTPSSEHDQIINASSMHLGGSVLKIRLANGFTPAPSDTFAIIDSTQAITGTFSNVANGARLTTADGLGSFRVHYGTASSFADKTVVMLSDYSNPEISLEASGTVLPNGGTLRFATDFLFEVTDPPLQFNAPEGPLDLVFPHIVPGTYALQISDTGELFSQALPAVAHPIAGPLFLTHEPFPSVTIFYRLARVVDSCQTVTVRNTGGSALTGLGAQLSGAGASFFTLDTSSTATTLDPNETTTLQVCFSAVDTDSEAHFATLTVFSDNALPVSMHLLGDNAPEPIVFVPPLEFVSGGLLPSTEIEPVRFAGTVSGQAGATVILEGSRDIDISDPWTEIARVTLDALGNGAILEVPAPGTIGLPRYFFQLRTLTP